MCPDKPGSRWLVNTQFQSLGMSSVVPERVKAGLLPLSHGGNTGSNPVGDARFYNNLEDPAAIRVPAVSRTCRLVVYSHIRRRAWLHRLRKSEKSVAIHSEYRRARASATDIYRFYRLSRKHIRAGLTSFGNGWSEAHMR